MVGALYDRSFNKRPLPTDKELAELAKNPAFLGVRGFNEWGTNLDRMLMIRFQRDKSKKLPPDGEFRFSKTFSRRI